MGVRAGPRHGGRSTTRSGPIALWEIERRTLKHISCGGWPVSGTHHRPIHHGHTLRSPVSRATITMRVRGVSDFSTTNESVLLVDPAEARQTQEALNSLHENSALRRPLGLAAGEVPRHVP